MDAPMQLWVHKSDIIRLEARLQPNILHSFYGAFWRWWRVRL